MPCLEGFLQRERVAEIYAEESGRELHDLEWYEMFAAQRFAIVSIRTTWRTVAYGDAEPPDDLDDVIMFREPARGDGRARRGTHDRARMTWEPPPRPEWVRRSTRADPAHRRGGGAALHPRRPARPRRGPRSASPTAASATSASDDFLEPLDVLLPALEHEAELTVIGRWMTRRFLLRFLEVRIQLAAYVRDDPGVVDEEIPEPWFVTGAPRTGTTILHALLAQDPASRVPEGWELLRPVPPPSPDPDEFAADARIPLADRELRLPGQVAGELDAIHVYRGRMHKECLSAMSFAFRSEEFTARYHVPSYVEWYERCDMRPAYDAHRLVLQILQRRFRNVHWVLKSPVHLSALPTLFAVYPDARLAITHRDPLTVLASLTSLVATLRWAHSDRVDFAEIGRYHERMWTRRARRSGDRVDRRHPRSRATCTTCTTPTSCRTRSV